MIDSLFITLLKTPNKNNLLNLFTSIIKEEKNNYQLDIGLKIEEFDMPINSYTDNNIIYFNENILNNISISTDINQKNNIFILIKNLYHEIRHIKQKKDAKSFVLNNESLFYIITTIINDYYDETDYMRNYKYQEIEIYANYFALTKLKALLLKNYREKFILEKIDTELSVLKNALTVNRRIDKANNELNEKIYISNIMNIIIRKHSNIFAVYPQLKLFYNETGLKSLNEILSDITLNENSNNISVFIEKIIN